MSLFKSRRNKLLLTILFALLLLPSPAADDFDVLRRQWVALDRGDALPDDKRALELLTLQRPDGTFTDIDYTDTDRGRWDLRRHWHALNVLARSHQFSETGLKGDPRLLDAVTRGIDNWSKNGYVNRNWWYQSIGIPLQSAQVLLTMGDALPPETRRNFRPILDRSQMGMTAQNRLHLATIHFLKGVLYRDPEMVEAGRAVILDEINFASPGHEGLQDDYSFHQHYAQMQFGNYGLGYLATGALWSGVMKGTRFAYLPDQNKILFDYFENGMRWVLYRELFDFNACGRQIVGDAQSEKFRAAKNAVTRHLDIPGTAENQRLREFFADTGKLEGNRFFYRSDFMVHRRNRFYFSVKMCSARVIGSESTNSENELGRHTAGGVIQLLQDGGEYLKIMPLWNWRRLPGLTALQDDADLRSPDKFYYNRSETVGGVSDGRDGATMLELVTDGLSARKSYLAFGDYIAAIGGDITGTAQFPVDTTVDSRWFRGPVEITAGQKKSTMTDGSRSFQAVTAIRHDQLEYRFPTPVDLTVEIAERSADWSKIQPSFRGNGVSGKVLTIRLEHGTRPAMAKYEYLCLPVGADASGYRRLAAGPAVHAAFDSKRELGFALFYAPGKVEIPGFGTLEAMQPAAILIRDGKLTVADLAQKYETLRFRHNGTALEAAVPRGASAGKSVPVQ